MYINIIYVYNYIYIHITVDIYIYLTTKEAMILKERKEGYMGRFGRTKQKGEKV